MNKKIVKRLLILSLVIATMLTYSTSCSKKEDPIPDPVPVTSLNIFTENEVTNVYIGYTLQMSAEVLPQDANDYSILWSVTPRSGDADISDNGLLTGTKLGVVTVNAAVNDKSAVEGSPEIKNSFEVKVIQLQYDGLWEGSLKLATTNMSKPIGTQSRYNGHAWVALESGELDVCEFQIASNQAGEDTKSSKGTRFNHELPATWKLGFRLFELDDSKKIVGEPLKSIDFEHTSINGSSPADSRVIYTFDLSGVNVKEGTMYFFALENLEENPERNYVSVNAYANQRRPSKGSNSVDIYYGDYPVMGSYSGTFNRDSSGLNGLGIRMANGYEYGGLEFDCTPSAMRTKIGDMWMARMWWSKPYDRTVDAIALGVARAASSPKGDLTVKIFGDDTEILSFDIPASDIQHTDMQKFGTLTNQLFPLEPNLKLSADVIYTIELSSPSSKEGDYLIQGVRHSSGGIISRAQRNANIPQPDDDVPFIEPNKSSGMVQRSFTHGDRWMQAGWITGMIDFPITFRVVQE